MLDPAKALRRAVRAHDVSKVERIVDWLLRRVPLIWVPQHPLISIHIIRRQSSAAEDGFPFEVRMSQVMNRTFEVLARACLILRLPQVDSHTHCVSRIVHPSEVAGLGVGERCREAEGRVRRRGPKLAAELEVARVEQTREVRAELRLCTR